MGGLAWAGGYGDSYLININTYGDLYMGVPRAKVDYARDILSNLCSQEDGSIFHHHREHNYGLSNSRKSIEPGKVFNGVLAW